MRKENKMFSKKYINPTLDQPGMGFNSGNEKNKKTVVFATLTMAVACALSSVLPEYKYNNPGVDENTNFVIAHAGGALENEGKTKKYLNCVEGFYARYKDGTRMFEYDLVFSSDGKLVGTHKFEYLPGNSLNNRISYDEYNATKIDGKFTGINEEKLFDLIRSYPDAKFIIDTKEKDPFLVYSRIIDLANEQGLDISSSIIPFIFSVKMLDMINEKYDFKELMYSNYKNHKTTKEILNILKDCPKIKYLHIFPYDFFLKDINEINKHGVRVFAHMDKSDIGRTALAYGCTGIFSDDISENEFKQKHYPYLKSKLFNEQNFAITSLKSEQVKNTIKYKQPKNVKNIALGVQF